MSAVAIAGAAAIAFSGASAAAKPKPSPSPSSATKRVPGDNGDVKVHRSTTPASDQRNEPHVCKFYLVGFNFDAGQKVSWKIKSWSPTGNRSVVLQGGLTLNQDGHGRTNDLGLPDGHYKLYWNFDGEHGSAKHKVFWVKCKPTKPSDKPKPPKPKPSPTITVPQPTPTESETPSKPAPKPKPIKKDFTVTG